MKPVTCLQNKSVHPELSMYLEAGMFHKSWYQYLQVLTFTASFWMTVRNLQILLFSPDAAETILCDFDHLDQSISITDADYCCVMTRGHAYDTIVQAQLLATPACYIGVIGSLAKRAGVFHRLVEEYGIDERGFTLIPTPVGLILKQKHLLKSQYLSQDK